MSKKNEPIDIVFSWVDGDDPTIKKQFNQKLKEFKRKDLFVKNSISPARLKNHGELRFALRSVYLYLPWIRKIFIVISDGQKLPFIKESDKVQFVYQSQIFPKWAICPSFSSNIIETFIHRIPQLAEHYIYFNDDFLIGKSLSPSFFFDSDGRPIIPVRTDDPLHTTEKLLQQEKIINPALINSEQEAEKFFQDTENRFLEHSWKSFFNTKYLLKKLYGENSVMVKTNLRLSHTPKPFRKSVQEELNNTFIFYIKKLSQNPFRTKIDIWFDFLRVIEGIRQGKYNFRIIDKKKDFLDFDFKSLESYKDLLRVFRNYTFISISQGLASKEELIEDVINLFEIRYPILPSWEVDTLSCFEKLSKANKSLTKISEYLY